MIEFKLRTKRGVPGVTPRKKTFRARGPQEALDYVRELLGIKDRITREKFSEAGGRCLKRVLPTKNRMEVIYPF